MIDGYYMLYDARFSRFHAGCRGKTPKLYNRRDAVRVLNTINALRRMNNQPILELVQVEIHMGHPRELQALAGVEDFPF